MLFGCLTIFILIGHLHALLNPSPPRIVRPIEPGSLDSQLNSSLTERREWPRAPFVIPYFHDEYAIKIIAYGDEPYDHERLSVRVNAGLDLIIYDVMRARKEEFTPRDPPIWIEKGVVHFHVGFLRRVSTIKLVLALQAVRNLMEFHYWPREIVTAEFGPQERWEPMARFSLKFSR